MVRSATVRHSRPSWPSRAEELEGPPNLLDPDDIRPMAGRLSPADDQLAQMIRPIAIDRRAELRLARGVLIASNSRGVVVGRWGADGPLEHLLDAAGCSVGMLLSEDVIGTSSFSTLVTRKPVYVAGEGHAAALLQPLTTAGTVIVHPVSRRVIGSLHVFCRVEDGSPAALSWVQELVREVERRAGESANRAQRLLMERYLAENRDSRHAVVALNDQTIITNAAAARLIGIEEQSILWERACQFTAAGAESEITVEVGRCGTLRVQFIPVHDGAETAGMILRLRRIDAAQRRGDGFAHGFGAAGLVGATRAWRDLCANLGAWSTGSLLLVGEEGVGKRSVAAALCPDAAIIEVAADAVDEPRQWVARLDQMVAVGATEIVISHVDRLPRVAATELARILMNTGSSTRVIATAEGHAHRDAPGQLLDMFATTVAVPALRDRIEDLPLMVRAITEQYVRLHPESDGVQWMTDALQALSRAHFPANIATLRQVVHDVLKATPRSYIGARDLPTAVLMEASRKRLVGLDRIEAAALLQALKDARGNKRKASASLGIARSTLYRKMRALGLDLDATTY